MWLLFSRKDDFLRVLASLLCALLLAGCETLAYYAQAVSGQVSLMAGKRSVDALLADKATPAPLRERLLLARSIRDYASRELMLPDNGSYRSYSDIGRPYAVWNVVAAPEFALAPLQSCFPVAGCVAYRGFFAQADAEHYAAGLRAQGYDVFVYGVAAYSTLGSFDDPLLSSFIRYPDTELARLIFHELAHQVAYVKDDSTFNESFAVVVEREGVRRWLLATGRGLAAWLDAEEQQRRLVAEIQQASARLERLYRSRISVEAMRERKQRELAALKQKLAGRYRDVVPNNAFLASFATYTELVNEFEEILRENNGDLERFYAQVKRYAASAPSSRGPLSKPTP
ncbi:MAG TPA: aminopeptidase [Burkholderiales bacterium]|jgi:predicted aminopeptidase|nr:aminopeptidase [Burkholderiales bacterium]